MNLDQILENFQYLDLQWLVPITAGVLVIVGGLLIGLVRGVTAGVIVALFFGGLLCLSPVLLNALQRQTGGALSPSSVTLARDTVGIAKLNNTMITDLTRVMTTVRAALEDAAPLLDREEVDPAVKAKFTEAMTTSQERLTALSDNLAQGQVMLRELDAALQALETDYRRTAPQGQ